VRGRLARVAGAASGTLFNVESVEVFDVYQGKGLADGKKSLAFSLVFRSPTRTLTDDEVNGVLKVIQEEIEKTTPFQIRK